MKGMALIELTNKKTGKKRSIVEHNIVTNAFSEVVKYAVNNFAAQSTSADKIGASSIFPINRQGMTGIILLPDIQTESASNLIVPESLSPVGASSYNRTTSTAGIYGTNNQNESQVIENGDGTFTWKYVTDFDTNQGNGLINCICLVPNGIPPLGLGRIMDVSTQNSRTYTGVNFSGTISYYESFLPVYIDYTNDCFYTLRNYNDGTNYYLRLYKHPLYLKTVDAGIAMYSLWQSGSNYYSYPAPIGKLVKTFQVTGMTGTRYTLCHATSDGKLYFVIGTSSYTSVANGSSFLLIEIDMQNGYTVTEHTITNNTGVSLFYFASTSQYASNLYASAFKGLFVDNGYIYMKNNYPWASSGTMYRVKISDSTWSNLGTFQYFPVCAFGDYMYGYNASIHRTTGVITTKQYAVGDYPNGYFVANMIPVYGTNEMLFYRFSSINSDNGYGWYSYYSMPYNLFMTINNLTTPLAKTSDDTMKITYMITWSV